MNHELAPETLSAYFDGELEPALRAGVEAHIPDCEQCRDQLRLFQDLSRFIQEHAPREMPESLQEALLGRERPDEAWSWFHPAWRPVAILAAACLGFLLAEKTLFFPKAAPRLAGKISPLPSIPNLAEEDEQSPESRLLVRKSEDFLQVAGREDERKPDEPWNPKPADTRELQEAVQKQYREMLAMKRGAREENAVPSSERFAPGLPAAGTAASRKTSAAVLELKVIRDAAAWQSLWRPLNQAPPPVDFERNMVAVLEPLDPALRGRFQIAGFNRRSDRIDLMYRSLDVALLKSRLPIYRIVPKSGLPVKAVQLK